MFKNAVTDIRDRVISGESFADTLSEYGDYFDTIYIGGGNAKHVANTDLGEKAIIVPNTAGILGGIRIWDLEESSPK